MGLVEDTTTLIGVKKEELTLGDQYFDYTVLSLKTKQEQGKAIVNIVVLN